MYAVPDLEILKATPRCLPQTLRPQSLFYQHGGSKGVEGTLRILPAGDNRSFQKGHALLPQRPLILFGMSFGNGYFTRKRIEVAICGMAHLFGEVAVVPDTIAMHTYRGKGYSEQECRARVREYGLKMKKRSRRAIERIQAELPAARLHLLDWERDASLPDYPEAFAAVSELFDSNEHFRNDVLTKGGDVLSARLGGESI